MNQFEMVAVIIVAVMLASVLRAYFKHRGERGPVDDAETLRLREEVKTLKDRVAVLERIATDKNHLLEQEFERLRER